MDEDSRQLQIRAMCGRRRESRKSQNGASGSSRTDAEGKIKRLHKEFEDLQEAYRRKVSAVTRLGGFELLTLNGSHSPKTMEIAIGITSANKKAVLYNTILRASMPSYIYVMQQQAVLIHPVIRCKP